MKIIKLLLIIYFKFFISVSIAADASFNEWVSKFKIKAIDSGISETTVNNAMNKVVYLPKVIKYDRYQPEFYEDTSTYIGNRVTKKKISNGLLLYKKHKIIVDSVEEEFLVEKEILLALMGIETNYGKYLGKMDILSSLATLSFDKRRSDFFTNELLVLLRLIDNNKIDPSILYGSWAGAFGNFQFMPTTINNYAIDHDLNAVIELKEINDSFASAANYLSQIGWEKNKPCFYEIELKKNIPTKYLNKSAKKLVHKKKAKFFKQYIANYNKLNLEDNLVSAIVTPDSDIVKDSNIFKPAYIVFKNYELVLKWNRSLRFALAACYLKKNFKNEL